MTFILYRKTCQHLEDLHNLIQLATKWPLHDDTKPCVSKDNGFLRQLYWGITDIQSDALKRIPLDMLDTGKAVTTFEIMTDPSLPELTQALCNPPSSLILLTHLIPSELTVLHSTYNCLVLPYNLLCLFSVLLPPLRSQRQDCRLYEKRDFVYFATRLPQVHKIVPGS